MKTDFYSRFDLTPEQARTILNQMQEIATSENVFAHPYHVHIEVCSLWACPNPLKPFCIIIWCGDTPSFVKEVSNIEEAKKAICTGIGFCFGVNDEDGCPMVDPFEEERIDQLGI